MQFQFSKVQSLGNDFILIEEAFQDFFFNSLQIQKICHRHFGIGADGLILFRYLDDKTVKMRFFNSDGSHAKMCGNGLRCLFFKTQAKTVVTDAGNYIGEVEGQKVSTWMKIPEVKSENVLQINNYSIPFIWVDSGVDHIVIQDFIGCEKVLLELAKELRSHSFFGLEGANVNFLSISDRLSVKTFERGVEQFTLACGTGGLACFSTLQLDQARVYFDSDQYCDFNKENGLIRMCAEVHEVFTGYFSSDFFK